MKTILLASIISFLFACGSYGQEKKRYPKKPQIDIPLITQFYETMSKVSVRDTGRTLPKFPENIWNVKTLPKDAWRRFQYFAFSTQSEAYNDETQTLTPEEIQAGKNPPESFRIESDNLNTVIQLANDKLEIKSAEHRYKPWIRKAPIGSQFLIISWELEIESQSVGLMMKRDSLIVALPHGKSVQSIAQGNWLGENGPDWFATQDTLFFPVEAIGHKAFKNSYLFVIPTDSLEGAVIKMGDHTFPIQVQIPEPTLSKIKQYLRQNLRSEAVRKCRKELNISNEQADNRIQALERELNEAQRVPPKD